MAVATPPQAALDAAGAGRCPAARRACCDAARPNRTELLTMPASSVADGFHRELGSELVVDFLKRDGRPNLKDRLQALWQTRTAPEKDAVWKLNPASDFRDSILDSP
jgi:hypothetical protein